VVLQLGGDGHLLIVKPFMLQNITLGFGLDRFLGVAYTTESGHEIKKQYGKMLISFIWLRIGTSSWLL
jgi:hypothetical protein